MTNNWPPNEPDTLEDLCLQQCVANIQTIAEKSIEDDVYKLKPDVFLLIPSLCDKLFKLFHDTQTLPNGYWEWIGIFNNTEKTRLCQVNFFKVFDDTKSPHNSELERLYSYILQVCLEHPLKQLEIVDCFYDHDFFSFFNKSKAKNSLLSLTLDGPSFVDRALGKHFTDLNLQVGDSIPDIRLECPLLQRLVLRDVRDHDLSQLPGCEIIHVFPQLTHLDLSNCTFSSSMIASLQNCVKLVWLNLHNIDFKNDTELINTLCKITKLRHLDISTESSLFTGNYDTDVEQTLRKLLAHLPELVSLDISRTNLAGKDRTEKSYRLEAKGAGDMQIEQNPIPGLEGRHLEFLGLYHCPYESYLRENLPAKQVTGNKDEEQLLLALRRYVDRSYTINDILNKLFILFKEERVINQALAFEGILASMKRHPDDKAVQISGSASLFYIMKGDQKSYIPQKHKRLLINCMLDGMEDIDADIVMIRNCCLTLCHLSMPQDVMIRNCCLTLYHLSLPQDVLYCYKRMISILLKLHQEDGQEGFIQRITLYMINHLACQVDGEEKRVVGDLGAIKIMLVTIRTKLAENSCDEIMEMAWSTMWNVTDETAINCDRFMDDGGMFLFIQCLQKFPDKPELLRNMMGLMGNIAEVAHLRPKLMEEAFITVFCELLESEKDGIEVSYNSAGVFSHMMADGPDAWTVESPSRAEVTEKLITAIKRWPLNCTRNINYRSFAPILKLVDAYHAIGAQYWSVWALCNLTTVYPQKYCTLLKREGGEEILRRILNNPETLKNIRDLAKDILENLSKEVHVCDDEVEGHDSDPDD